MCSFCRLIVDNILGNFKDGLRHGFGRVIYFDGRIEAGWFEHGTFKGTATDQMGRDWNGLITRSAESLDQPDSPRSIITTDTHLSNLFN